MYIIGIICLAQVHLGQGTPSFGGTVSTGSGLIYEGGVFDLSCQVESLTDDYSVAWYRKTSTGDRTAIYRDDMLINIGLGREAEAYSLHNVYDIRITQVEGQDLGYLLNGNNYTCKVTVKSTGEVVLKSRGLILIASYIPSSMYPICETCDFSSDLIGSNVSISCYSEPGNPSVQLQWSRNGTEIKNLQTITTPSLNYLNYTFILEADDLESCFSCSNGKQTCNTCAEESSPTMLLDTDRPQQPSNTVQASDEETTNLPSDSGTQTASPTVIGASIGAVLFLALCILSGVLLYRRRDPKEKATTAFQESTNNESVGDLANQVRTSRNEYTIDNVPIYTQVKKLKSNDKNLRESLQNESGIVNNSIYVGYDSDDVEIAKPQCSDVNETTQPRAPSDNNYYSSVKRN